MILYQDCSSHLDSSKNIAARGRGLFSLYIYIENFIKSSCQTPLDRFQYNFAEMFLWWSSTKIVQAIWIRQKTWPPGGGAYFPYIIYIENFKNLLVRNHWTDFNITWQECTKFVQAVMIHQKTWPLGGGAYFPYVAIWNILKIFLSETTGPISIWQNCSFGDPLSRFGSSRHDAWKKTWPLGSRAIKFIQKS